MVRKRKPSRRPIARLGFGDWLRSTVQLIKQRGLGLLAMALPFAMASVWLEQSIQGCYPNSIRDLRIVVILSTYATGSVSYVASGLICRFALPFVGVPMGARATATAFTWRHLASLLAISLLAPLGFIAGLVVAVVPGIVIWLSWVVAAPIAAIEGKGPIDALRFSARLTWGSRRSLFYGFAAVQVLTLIAILVPAVVTGQGVAALFQDPAPLTPVEALLNGLVESLQVAMSGALCCAAYASLRRTDAMSLPNAGKSAVS